MKIFSFSLSLFCSLLNTTSKHFSIFDKLYGSSNDTNLHILISISIARYYICDWIYERIGEKEIAQKYIAIMMIRR